MNKAKKPRILILEDEKQLSKAITDAFSTRNFETTVVANVGEGIEELKKCGTVDAIWLDHYLLGEGNGLDFLVQVKNNQLWKSIPVFVVSNDATSTNIRSYLELGVSNYYTKADYDIGQIINDIEYAMKEALNNQKSNH